VRDLVQKLVETYGVAGREESVREVILAEIEPLADEVIVDTLGNAIAFMGPQDAPTIAFSAHMDEIGLIITHIDDKGFLRFSNVGGISPHVLLGQLVRLPGGREGCVGYEWMEDFKDLKLDKMFIDIGCASKEESLKHVQVGDAAAYARPFTDLGEFWVSKALDDRIGCAISIQAMRRLKKPANRLAFIFSVQEEVGVRGARTAAYRVEPDLGIALDVTLAADTPKSRRGTVAMGDGAAIKVMDKSLMAHPKVRGLLENLARERDIPHQLEVLEFGGTDAGAIHLSKEGVPSGCISIPTRFVHTPTEMVKVSDVEACVDLVTAVAETPIKI